ncbi:MAG: hypothetical protein NVSMB46_07180 [Candidatus Saccharimonadales bacterium]
MSEHITHTPSPNIPPLSQSDASFADTDLATRYVRAPLGSWSTECEPLLNNLEYDVVSLLDKRENLPISIIDVFVQHLRIKEMPLSVYDDINTRLDHMVISGILKQKGEKFLTHKFTRERLEAQVELKSTVKPACVHEAEKPYRIKLPDAITKNDRPYTHKERAYILGELSHDELFDPIYTEKPQTITSTVLSEWDKKYQQKIQALCPEKDKLSFEEEKLTAALIQKGRFAEKKLQQYGISSFKPQERVQHQRDKRLGREAQQELIIKNLRLAAWFVRESMDLRKANRIAKNESSHRGKFVKEWSALSGGELDYSDRMQLASVGLIKATETYNGQCRFSTYALWNMESVLLRAKSTQQSPINFSSAIMSDITKLQRSRESYLLEHAQYPRYEDLAQDLKLTPSQTVTLTQTENRKQQISWEKLQEYDRQKALSLDESQEYGMDEYISLAEILVDNGSTITTEDYGSINLLGELIDKDLSKLTDREQEILERRYGLGIYDEPQTLDHIGKAIGISRERTRQLEARAHSHYRIMYLHTFYDKRNDFDEITSEEDPQYGLRSLVNLDEFDDIALGLTRPEKYTFTTEEKEECDSNSHTKQGYSLHEFNEMRSKHI